MPPARFEPAIPGSEQPQTHTLDRASTRTGCDLCFSLDIVSVMWAGLVEHECEKRNFYEVLVENLKKRDRLKELGVDGWLLLKWVFKEIGWNGVDYILLALVK